MNRFLRLSRTMQAFILGRAAMAEVYKLLRTSGDERITIVGKWALLLTWVSGELSACPRHTHHIKE